jgi:3,4-dihydroxy 2-butanone 4-phosphate synthase/GTP cyclohydrolase II
MRNLAELESRMTAAARFRRSHGRPFILVSYAQSVDGSIAGRGRERIRLSGPESMRLTHAIRALCDTILVGIGTVIADDPHLAVKPVRAKNPQPIVLDTRLRTPRRARLLRRADVRPWLIHGPGTPRSRVASLQKAGAEPVTCRTAEDGRIDIAALMRLLADRAVNSVMVEGGARVITSIIRHRLADLFVVTISPRVVGGLTVIDPERFQDIPNLQFSDPHYQTLGRDVVLWARPRWTAG